MCVGSWVNAVVALGAVGGSQTNLSRGGAGGTCRAAGINNGTGCTGPEFQIAAVHPNVQREAKRLRDVAQLAACALRNGGGSIGWRGEGMQREACRVRTIKQLERALRIQPKIQPIQPRAKAGTSGSWR